MKCFSYILISWIVFGFAIARSQELHFVAAYMPYNNNSNEDIERDIKAIDWTSIIPKGAAAPSVENILIESSNQSQMHAVVTVPKKKELRISVSRVDFRGEEATPAVMEDFIRIRLNGFTAAFAMEIISSKNGFSWSGFKLRKNLLDSTVAIPSWMISRIYIPKNAALYFFDDGYIRRFLIVIGEKVEGEVAIDLRDAGNDFLRRKLLDTAFVAIGPQMKDERDSIYFAKVGQWLFRKQRIRWISPFEIPSLNEY